MSSWSHFSFLFVSTLVKQVLFDYCLHYFNLFGKLCGEYEVELTSQGKSYDYFIVLCTQV